MSNASPAFLSGQRAFFVVFEELMASFFG